MIYNGEEQKQTRPPSYSRFLVEVHGQGIVLKDYLVRSISLKEREALDLIDFGSVHVEGKRETNPSRQVSGGEEIRIYWPWYGNRRFYEIDPRRILYRDRFLIAYDKEPGVPCQEMPADAYNNVFAALSRYLEKTSSHPYVAIHHRLDRETGGVMVFALQRSANRPLGDAFKHHKVEKEYLVWVQGRPSRDFWIASQDITRKKGRYSVCPKGEGKAAETAFRVLGHEKKENGSLSIERSLLLASPRTGRTHQIRLHLAACKHPVIGDRLYGEKPETGFWKAERLYLHAYRLKLPHPATGSEFIVEAPVPPDWPLPEEVRLPDMQ